MCVHTDKAVKKKKKKPTRNLILVFFNGPNLISSFSREIETKSRPLKKLQKISCSLFLEHLKPNPTP